MWQDYESDSDDSIDAEFGNGVFPGDEGDETPDGSYDDELLGRVFNFEYSSQGDKYQRRPPQASADSAPVFQSLSDAVAEGTRAQAGRYRKVVPLTVCCVSWNANGKVLGAGDLAAWLTEALRASVPAAAGAPPPRDSGSCRTSISGDGGGSGGSGSSNGKKLDPFIELHELMQKPFRNAEETARVQALMTSSPDWKKPAAVATSTNEHRLVVADLIAIGLQEVRWSI